MIFFVGMRDLFGGQQRLFLTVYPEASDIAFPRVSYISSILIVRESINTSLTSKRGAGSVQTIYSL